MKNVFCVAAELGCSLNEIFCPSITSKNEAIRCHNAGVLERMPRLTVKLMFPYETTNDRLMGDPLQFTEIPRSLRSVFGFHCPKEKTEVDCGLDNRCIICTKKNMGKMRVFASKTFEENIMTVEYFTSLYITNVENWMLSFFPAEEIQRIEQ